MQDSVSIQQFFQVQYDLSRQYSQKESEYLGSQKIYWTDWKFLEYFTSSPKDSDELVALEICNDKQDRVNF